MARPSARALRPLSRLSALLYILAGTAPAQAARLLFTVLGRGLGVKGEEESV